MSEWVRRSQAPRCPGGTIYTIIPGDSLYGLARRFNITVRSILAANPGIDPLNLQIGDRICIPAPDGNDCPGGFRYTIRAGDTFYSLARRFGTVVPALIAANPGVDPDRLMIGQSICIPAPSPVPCPDGTLYTIVAGDTLYNLSRRFGVTVDEILEANPGLDPNNLQVGRMICIPD